MHIGNLHPYNLGKIMQKQYDIKTFGACGDGKTLCTQSIQYAIDMASQSNGAVVISEGIFLTGALFLRENTTLILEKKAILLGSQDIADYPLEETRFEGRMCLWPLALLNAKNLNKITIEGAGIIDGNGCFFWKQFWDARDLAIKANAPFSNRDIARPRLLFFENCRNVTVQGITLQNSGFWHFHLYLCQDVQISSISIKAPHIETRAASSDGIDIDACKNITIRNCYFETDDDCVCLKNGKGPEAHMLNPPTENITIENCIFGFGHGAVTLGSEAARISNVTVRNCQIIGENTLVRCKFRNDTNQEFSRIMFEDIQISNGGWLFDIQTWVSRQDEILSSKKEPSLLSDLVVRNVAVQGLLSPGILGEETSLLTLQGILLENITICSLSTGDKKLSRSDSLEEQNGGVPGKLTFARNQDITFKNMVIDGEKL